MSLKRTMTEQTFAFVIKRLPRLQQPISAAEAEIAEIENEGDALMRSALKAHGILFAYECGEPSICALYSLICAASWAKGLASSRAWSEDKVIDAGREHEIALHVAQAESWLREAGRRVPDAGGL